ncbi:dihydrolipoamide acetyltransferase family protein [Micrococcoides hystricis]|uniref:Dihydrolipoamide acetyltransferase component of pyruvate dehydrogenase complex n=1 Tax=Micrococcoides hystricis TaxID=1572761 RepID=A0ABV6P9B3_9MICC
MSQKVFKLPDLGEGLTGADLMQWLVAVGDEVQLDQPIAEVETAKSLVQVPSPYAGKVHQLHGEVGEEILVGAPLITIEVEQALDYREEERAGASAPEEPVPDPEEEGSGAVLIGYGTSGGSGRRRRRRKPEAPAAAKSTAENAAADAPSQSEEQAPRVVSPLVRKLAHERGVKLSEVTGSGPGGLILRADILAATDTAAETSEETAATTAPAAAATHAGETDGRTGLRIAKVDEVKGVRKRVVEAMTTSRREIPEATVWLDIDVTDLVELRAQQKAATGQAPTLLAFVGRYVLAGLQRYPELNTRFDGDTISYFDGVNLGFAMQTDRGLMVPALTDTAGKNIMDLDQEIRDLTEKARTGQATPQELTRGTFTINNYGVFGVDGSAAVINHPEVAILGLGRILERPWVKDGELCVRKIMEITLSFDHRVCDGGTASGFLSFVADCLQNPTNAAMML